MAACRIQPGTPASQSKVVSLYQSVTEPRGGLGGYVPPTIWKYGSRNLSKFANSCIPRSWKASGKSGFSCTPPPPNTWLRHWYQCDSRYSRFFRRLSEVHSYSCQSASNPTHSRSSRPRTRRPAVGRLATSLNFSMTLFQFKQMQMHFGLLYDSAKWNSAIWGSAKWDWTQQKGYGQR